jgi:hypothetical protein
MKQSNFVLATCHSAFEELASSEIRKLGFSAKRIGPGLLRCEGKDVAAKLLAATAACELIFVRHLAPMDVTFQVERSVEATAARVVSRAPIDLQSAISVHVRNFDTDPGSLPKAEIAKEIERLLREAGAVVQRKDPLSICSVVLIGRNVYVGVATPAEMLSSCPRG